MKNYADDYDIEVVFCGGDPRLVMMDAEGNEIEEIELDEKNEEEIVQLIESKGFKKLEEVD